MSTTVREEIPAPVDGPGRYEAAAEEVHAPLQIALICLLFILSGACGLAYEVIWSRYLGLMLGNTLLVHSVVLGAFMGGMAISALALRRWVTRLRRPLFSYGVVELGVSVYALIFPSLMEAADGLVTSAAATLPPGTAGLLAVRLLVAVLLILPPSLMLGTTFPLLTAHLDRAVGAGAGGANWLYLANSSGAVAGSLLTGFWLIREMGNTGALLAVAILNIIVAAIALIAGAPLATEEDATAASEARSETAVSETLRRAVLIAIGASGATAFIYEVAWTRLFAVTLGSSTYSFTLMLAAFISGLAVGSAVAALPVISRRPLFFFAGAELLIGLVIVLSTPYYARLPFYYWNWRWVLRPVSESIWLYHLFQYGLTFLVMLAPTLLFGLTFPLAIRAAAATGGAASRHAAGVYGWNSIGAICGVSLASGLLIPYLGLRTTLLVAAVLNAAIAAFLWLLAPPARGRPLAWPAIALLVPLLAIISTPWIPGSLTHGTFRSTARPSRSWAAYERALAERPPVYRYQGGESIVSVVRTRNPDTGQSQLALIVDGKADASSHGDMPTQVLLAQIPLLIHPDPKDVFVLGLGSGVTAGSVLTHPVRSLNCAEISRGVVGASRAFAETNGRPWEDPRFNLVVDDGKLVLAAGRRQYDVIISEPTNPWISGIGNLFSHEAFRQMERSLRPGGVAAQWIHSYDLTDELVATIVRTYREVFPHVLIFQGAAGDYIMVGSREPQAIDIGRLTARMAQDAVKRDLARISIHGPAGLLGQQTHGAADMPALEEGGGINTDDYPLLEFLAPLAMYTGQRAERLVQSDRRFTQTQELLLAQYIKSLPDKLPAFRELLQAQADERYGQPGLHLRLLRTMVQQWPEDKAARAALAGILAAGGRPEGALDQVRAAGGPSVDETRKRAMDQLDTERTSVYSAALGLNPRGGSPAAP